MKTKHQTLHPSAAFKKPEDVISDPNLSHEQAFTILNNWRDEVQHRLESTGEGMGENNNDVDLLASIDHILHDFTSKP